jgi:hypothetical protein
VLLACVVAIGIQLTFAPVYQASHWLEAPDDYFGFKGVTAIKTELVQTERALFFSPIVLDPVLADPALRKAPSLRDPDEADGNIRKSLSLEGDGTKSRLIVNYQDTDPAAAAMVANAIAESYLRILESYDSERVERLVRWLEPEVMRQEQKVDELRTIVQELSQATLGYAPGHRLSVMDDEHRMALLERLMAQITELRIQLRVLENQRKRDGLDLSQTQAEQVPTADAEREALADRLSVLEEMYKEERERLEHFSGETTRLEFARQELELENEALQKLRRRVITFRDEVLANHSVRTLAVAQVPKTPVETFPTKKMLAASGATFLLTCFLGLLWEIKAQRVTDSRDVAD